MKTYFALSLLLTVTACTPEDLVVGGGPVTDEITRGGHWNLHIGHSSATVYAQLQALGLEKNFDRVNVAARMPYGHPAELPVRLGDYDALTLESTSGRTDRIVLQFAEDTIRSVERGGGMLDSVAQWPAGSPAAEALVVGDSLSAIPEKLTALYRDPRYAAYALVLPDKPLARPYDPDMGNYDRWHFTFFEDHNGATTDRFTVRLQFSSGTLDALRITRQRFELVF